MGTIEADERFLNTPCQKNRTNAVSDAGPATELQTSPSPVSIVHHRHFEKCSVSDDFESCVLLFFKISYFLGIVPYYWKTVKLGNGSRSVKSLSSKFHSVIVAIVHFCAILRFLMRFCLLSYDLNNPLNYFKTARTLLSTALCSFCVWTLWRRHCVCQQILNRLAHLSYFPNVTCLRRKSVQYPIVCISIAILCLTSIYRAIDECYIRWEDLCKSSQFIRETLCDKRCRICQILLKALFCVFNYLGRTTRRLPRVQLFTFALTMWQICKSYAVSLRLRNQRQSHYQNHEIMSVLMAYEELKSISVLMRDLVGEMLVSEIVEDIVYFSLEVQLRLRQTDWFSIFVVFETWMVAFFTYFIAACATDNIQEVSVWLSRDDVLSKLSPGKVTTLHAQLSTNPIGMKGGSLFTLTKTVLANVVTVWATYFIILLQFQIDAEL